MPRAMARLSRSSSRVRKAPVPFNARTPADIQVQVNRRPIATYDMVPLRYELLLETRPQAVAEPIAREIHNVLTTTRRDIVTISSVLALYFASSGSESVRI